MTKPKPAIRVLYVEALESVGGDRVTLQLLTRNPSVNDRRRATAYLTEADTGNFLSAFWEFNHDEAHALRRAAIAAREAAYRIAPPKSLFARAVARTRAQGALDAPTLDGTVAG